MYPFSKSQEIVICPLLFLEATTRARTRIVFISFVNSSTQLIHLVEGLIDQAIHDVFRVGETVKG